MLSFLFDSDLRAISFELSIYVPLVQESLESLAKLRPLPTVRGMHCSQQIESGRPITVTTLLRICKTLRMSMASLVRGLGP